VMMMMITMSMLITDADLQAFLCFWREESKLAFQVCIE